MNILWWHIHRDPDWQVEGIHRYDECRCGARRTTRYYSNLEGPSRPDWPSRRDEHGVWPDSSGWQRQPPGGWPRLGPITLPDHWMSGPMEDFDGMSDTYTCANCEGVFIKAWSDEEARAEYEATEPNAAARSDVTDVICDDCYRKFMAWAAREGIDL